MNVRDVEIGDVEELKALHRKQNFGYKLPDVNGTEFIVRKTIAIAGKPKMAILARQTVELYMLADNEWETPGVRLMALNALHQAVGEELRKMGIRDAQVWLPPQVEKSFSRRLIRSFGWMKAPWTCLVRMV